MLLILNSNVRIFLKEIANNNNSIEISNDVKTLIVLYLGAHNIKIKELVMGVSYCEEKNGQKLTLKNA